MSRRMFKGSALLLSLFLVGSTLTGCTAVSTAKKVDNSQGAVKREVKMVTDLVGREVKVEIPAQRIVAIGPGALRLVTYDEGASMVVGIEEIEKKASPGRSYMLAYPDLKKLPSIGQGGPDIAPNEESLVGIKPDVIFVSYLVDKAKADQLQAKTGIPVVVLSYSSGT